VAVVQCSREKASSAKGDAVSATALDLGEQGMASELTDEAANALAAPARFLSIGGLGVPEPRLEVVVGQTVDEVRAGEHSLKGVCVGASDGVET
jgi:hypothetical protein